MTRALVVVSAVGVALTLGLARGAAAQVASADPPREYTYAVRDGQPLRVFVFAPGRKEGAARPSAILLFHGGGWSAGAPDWTFDAARRFAGAGMVAIAVQYRLSGGNVTPIDALQDTCDAFAWTRRQAGELGIGGRVAGYGVSAGGHLVAATVTVGCPPGDKPDRAGPDALVLWSPALNVARDGWFQQKLQGRASASDYSPAGHVGASTPPTSIVHGDRDTLTPLAGVREYCDRLTALGVACELNVYPGVGHLLTRNLANQESDFDPDPDARAAGIAQHLRFLERLGFTPGR